MSPRLRRLGLLVGLPVLLVGLHTAYWRWAAAELEEGLARWVADQRALGMEIEHGEPRLGGWPLEAQLTMPDPVLRRPDQSGALVPGGWEWRGGRARFSIRLWSPWAVEIDAAGVQALRLGVGPGGIRALGAADRLLVTIPFEPGAPPQGATLELRGLWLDSSIGHFALAEAEGGIAFPHAADASDPSITLSLSALDIDLPEHAAGALGPRIATLALDAQVLGTVPRAQGLAERMSGWRDAGGSLTVPRIALSWGPLAVEAAATLALDEEMQPMGAANARVSGYAATLDALVAQGVIRVNAANAAKVVLNVLARSPAQGGPPAVEVPVTLNGRQLTLGRIPLLRLPALVWPELPAAVEAPADIDPSLPPAETAPRR